LTATQNSIVLVTVDCLRADHVGFGGYTRPVTPFLDSLAESSTVFSDAIVAGAPTYFSFPAIIASRYPLGLGRDVVGIAPDEATIATALRGAGYRTAAFVAGNPYLTARFGYDEGFDRFHDFLDGELDFVSEHSFSAENNRRAEWNRRLLNASRRTRWTTAAYDELYFWYCQWHSSRQDLSFNQLRRYPAADVVVDQACSWLNGLAGERFFLWIHLMDPHHPYYPPQEALSSVGAPHITARRARFLNSFWNRGDIGPRRLEKQRAEILSLYDAGVYWADKQICRLVNTLQQRQLWNNTVFALTGDHGEEFLEHGARYHSPANLPEQLIRVPLLLRAPGLPATRIAEGPFSLIHLAPTLLAAAGVSAPENFQGCSFWDQISSRSFQGETAIAECVEECNNPFRASDRMHPRLLAIRDREYKLVVRFSEERVDLYDLKNDSGEHSPLPASSFKRERARLLRIAQAHLEKARRNRNSDLALRARLRELQHSLGLKREPAPDVVPA
jgi:arylsulfatase A-like enzyme